MPNESPRIVTDEKIPCLVVACRFDRPITAAELIPLLAEHLERVSNVYNCPAFRLDEKCEELIAINGSNEVSIVLFMNKPSPVETTAPFRQLEGRLKAGKNLIDSIIEGKFGRKIIPEAAWIETTGKTPN